MHYHYFLIKDTRWWGWWGQCHLGYSSLETWVPLGRTPGDDDIFSCNKLKLSLVGCNLQLDSNKESIFAYLETVTKSVTSLLFVFSWKRLSNVNIFHFKCTVLVIYDAGFKWLEWKMNMQRLTQHFSLLSIKVILPFCILFYASLSPCLLCFHLGYSQNGPPFWETYMYVSTWFEATIH